MIVLTPLAIKQNSAVQKLLLEKAIEVYAEDFNEEKYDIIKFAKQQGFAVDY